MANSDYGHYTSQSGLIEIISSETLWATNIKFLNDEQEFQHALELIRGLIPKSKITPDHRDHAVYSQFIEQIEKELNSLDRYVTESIYTFSFSQEIDLLSQWRGYCSDNNGFCLVFDIEKTFEHVKEKHPNVHLMECVYETNVKEKKIKEVLNNYWSQFFSASTKEKKKNIIDQLAKDVTLLASYFKHPSFSEEKEKRIVVILEFPAHSGLQFRTGRFSLIPFISLPVPRLCIKKICIGPTANKELAKRALEMFLETIYRDPFGGPGSFFSKTPYRPW
jgi:hypothetical protein